MSEGFAFCTLLFLSLYGVFSIIRHLSLHILKPADTITTFSLAYLHENSQNAEQIIRYFRAKADGEAVLLLVDNGIGEEEKAIVRKLCGNRRDVRLLSAENLSDGQF